MGGYDWAEASGEGIMKNWEERIILGEDIFLVLFLVEFGFGVG
jgi:hypothetical protein